MAIVFLLVPHHRHDVQPVADIREGVGVHQRQEAADQGQGNDEAEKLRRGRELRKMAASEHQQITEQAKGGERAEHQADRGEGACGEHHRHELADLAAEQHVARIERVGEILLLLHRQEGRQDGQRHEDQRRLVGPADQGVGGDEQQEERQHGDHAGAGRGKQVVGDVDQRAACQPFRDDDRQQCQQERIDQPDGRAKGPGALRRDCILALKGDVCACNGHSRLGDNLSQRALQQSTRSLTKLSHSCHIVVMNAR